MALVVTQGFSIAPGSTKLHASRHLMSPLRARRNLTPQERANLYVSRMPLAVITASPGAHSACSESDRS